MTKPKPKNADQIAVEIDKLKKMQPKVRAFSFFGDNNRQSIAAQVKVLEERLNEDEIYDHQETDAAWTENQTSCALDALRWSEGEKGMDAPSDGWKPLVEK